MLTLHELQRSHHVAVPGIYRGRQKNRSLTATFKHCYFCSNFYCKYCAICSFTSENHHQIHEHILVERMSSLILKSLLNYKHTAVITTNYNKQWEATCFSTSSLPCLQAFKHSTNTHNKHHSKMQTLKWKNHIPYCEKRYQNCLREVIFE